LIEMVVLNCTMSPAERDPAGEADSFAHAEVISITDRLGTPAAAAAGLVAGQGSDELVDGV
jgi:hypothetical protein